MPSADDPALVVARFLKANSYTQTLEAFLREAGLSQSSVSLNEDDLTIEKILEEKRQLDASLAYEKKAGDDEDEDEAARWTTPAPTVPHAPPSLTPATSNVLCVRGDASSSPQRIIATTADRAITLLSSSSYDKLATLSDNDSPVLSLTLNNNNNYETVVDRVRDHTKYAVSAAVLPVDNGIIIATAGWDKNAIAFVRNPATQTAFLVLSRRDSTYFPTSPESRSAPPPRQHQLHTRQPGRAPVRPEIGGSRDVAPAAYASDHWAAATTAGAIDMINTDREEAAVLVHVATMAPQTPYSTPAVVWRPDGSGVYVNGDDGAVRGVEAKTGKVVATLPPVAAAGNGASRPGHEVGTKVRALWCGLLDGREVLLSGGFDKRLVVWECGQS
ncbi:hypothetical protein DV735_g5908, partial [Chaetothyriales sp. CBS 134920]